MTPALRLAFSLVLSLLVWLPTVPAALANSEDPARIALRYLLALVVSRIGVGLVFRVVNGYAVEEEVPEPEAASEPEDLDPFGSYGRRREDIEEAELTAEDLLDEALSDVADSNAMAPN